MRPLLTLPLLAVAGCAAIGPIALPGGGGSLDASTVAAGLREALSVGSGRAVDRLAAVDGYLADELLRVTLPDELESMAAALRAIGLDRQVDELEVAMNRAAEQAAGEAREVLGSAIRQLSIPDAFAILRGGPTAATDHLERTERSELESRFAPIVARRLDEVGLARIYDRLAERYNALPFVSTPAVDLDAHVTGRALDGLFTALGQEEARIREDPVARTTELLRRVFREATA